jgi:hypothetical protein
LIFEGSTDRTGEAVEDEPGRGPAVVPLAPPEDPDEHAAVAESEQSRRRDGRTR